MKLLLHNLNTGSLLSPPTLSVDWNGGIYFTTPHFCAIAIGISSINSTPQLLTGMIGSIYNCGTLSDHTVSFAPRTDIGTYYFYTGTADANGTYLKLKAMYNGTLGTITTAFLINSFGSNTNSYNQTYTQSIFLPQPSSYSVKYINNLITNGMSNKDTLIYDKSSTPVISLGFTQISETEKSDLENIYNWRAEMRFFPNIDGNGTNYYDCYWANDFDFSWTVPTYSEGGYNGNIQLNSLYGNNTAKRIY